jgi:virulence-associated protein VapD
MKKATIVYVPRRSRIRLYKIAKAAKLSNEFKLILVCEENYYDKELFEGLFDEVIFYNKRNVINKSKIYKDITKKLKYSSGLNNLIKIINNIKPDLVHAFCEPYDHIEKIIKETNYPVIMSDGADFSGISSGIENLDKKTKKQEKFCFENVEGLIYKGPKQVTDYYRKYGYKIKCRELTWFDHTDEDIFVNHINKLSQKDNEIHTVFTGHISTNPKIKYCYYIPLAKILAKQKIHLHIYPNPNQYKTSNDYLKLDKNEPYFHFHKPLPMKKLINEIAKYDWGIWIHSEETTIRTTKEKIKTGIGNKMFTYLEAGLPIIVSDSRLYGVEIVIGNNLGFKINDKEWVNLKTLIKHQNISQLINNIKIKRKELSIQSNKSKLAGFYNEILKECQK